MTSNDERIRSKKSILMKNFQSIGFMDLKKIALRNKLLPPQSYGVYAGV
jgi:hypothetical protein